MSVPPDRNKQPSVIPWLKSIAPTVIGATAGYYSAKQMQKMANKEAEKNRQFQKEMSDTAHQREVRDLMLAGINPMLSSHGSGASTPAGAQAQTQDFSGSMSRGVASALAVRQARANIELTDAQALQARTSAYDVQTSASMRYGLLDAQRALAEANTEQVRELLPQLLAKAKEEVRLTASSADRARIAAELDLLMKPSRENLAKFEKQIGEMGPWARLLFEAARSLK